jgi:NAD(P)-dependent dehydrogenase (short-subunit alcohol dehydrogenase family)/pimeloyl-ACP methyl ester carboxylesterase
MSNNEVGRSDARSFRITVTDGVSLAVYERGDPARPTVLLVHGYPDDHTVWDAVAAELAGRFHVVGYDVRGAGRSGEPSGREGYLLDRLAEDLATVADRVSPDAPVHLVGHDWGSIQGWHALSSPRLAGRIASYTSISGPSLDHVGAWMRARAGRPTPRGLRELATQLAASGYIGLFQLPAVPELLLRTGALTRVMRLLTRGDTGLAAPTTGDAIRGLELYRANMPARLSRPRPAATRVPVQVLAPTRDPFVTTALQTGDLARWTDTPRVRRLPGGHWLPRSRPDVVARCVTELVEYVAGGGADVPSRATGGAPAGVAPAVAQAPALRRAEVRGSGADRYTGATVVVTGAGSGIGRETALAFAGLGAYVVVADRDEPAAKETVSLIAVDGSAGQASAYQVDVADAEAMAAFAERVIAEHGVPEVVVNNAGIGMAGPFTETSLDDWRRVIDVNLWGVIHGCRVFAEPMIAHGEGGQIVNIASAAAYLPTRVLPAYATTKSAVLTLTQCLRAELAEHGIGVTAVCPGLVHTNITSTTRFVGTDDAEQSRRQQASHALYGRRNFTPDRAAREIVRAARRNTALAPVTPEAKIGLMASRLTPALLRAAAKREVTF